MAHRKPRPLAREERAFRDDRLFLVATEDTYAAKQYMDFLKNPRVKVIVLETPAGSGMSAPRDVVERLRTYRDGIEMEAGDQCWVLLDTDHWIEASHRAAFIEAIRDANRNGFSIATSNPCFDVWLLLHVADVPKGTVFENCRTVGDRIREIMGSFNKRVLNREWYTLDHVREAIRRARSLETDPDDPKDYWPEKAGTRVYLLMEQILNPLLNKLPRHGP